MKQRNHCLGVTCEDGGAGDDCMCPCDGCSLCTCGCLEPNRQGLERIEAGLYKGRGAGYQIVRRALGWDVLAPEGDSILVGQAALVETFDLANAAAVKHAREAGHGHP